MKKKTTSCQLFRYSSVSSRSYIRALCNLTEEWQKRISLRRSEGFHWVLRSQTSEWFGGERFAKVRSSWIERTFMLTSTMSSNCPIVKSSCCQIRTVAHKLIVEFSISLVYVEFSIRSRLWMSFSGVSLSFESECTSFGGSGKDH